jgi:hypothetical protein
MLHRCSAVLAALAVCVALGCGGDSDAGDGGSGSHELRIAVADRGSEKVVLDLPDSVDGGLVEISLSNDGDMLHDAQLFRVDGRRSAKELVDEWIEQVDSAPKPAWAHAAGGVAPVTPGETRTVTQVLEPGRYVVADTQERDKGIGGKLSNAAKGGTAVFEVVGDGDGELPPTKAVVTANDTGFEIDRLRPGVQRVTFVNAGEEPHHAVLHRVPPGVSFQAAARRLLGDRRFGGWPPIGVPGSLSTTVMEGGGIQVTELKLERGRYIIACWASDRAGGAPHAGDVLGGFEVPQTGG